MRNSYVNKRFGSTLLECPKHLLSKNCSRLLCRPPAPVAFRPLRVWYVRLVSFEKKVEFFLNIPDSEAGVPRRVSELCTNESSISRCVPAIYDTSVGRNHGCEVSLESRQFATARLCTSPKKCSAGKIFQWMSLCERQVLHFLDGFDECF